MDLAVLWRQRRWVALIDYITLLEKSSTSRLREAMINDPEIAQQIIDAEADNGAQEAWSPSLTDWTTEAVIQAEVRDLLQEVVKVLAAIKSGIPVVQQEKLRPPPKTKGKPFPRPRTEVDKARRRAEENAYYDALAVFSPHSLN